MLDNKGFDLWADGYDKSVSLCEQDNDYPFTGYKDVLNTIYNQIRVKNEAKILDIGFGTGILTKRLYDDGYEVWGIDFSEKMIEISRQKMHEAGMILIGDVAFETREMHDKCKLDCEEDNWDNEEFYFVFEEIEKSFKGIEFTQISHCAGVFKLLDKAIDKKIF